MFAKFDEQFIGNCEAFQSSKPAKMPNFWRQRLREWWPKTWQFRSVNLWQVVSFYRSGQIVLIHTNPYLPKFFGDFGIFPPLLFTTVFPGDLGWDEKTPCQYSKKLFDWVSAPEVTSHERPCRFFGIVSFEFQNNKHAKVIVVEWCK